MSDIVRLLEGRLGFCSQSNVTSEQIEEAEYELNLRFSDEYRAYLSAYGVASILGHELTGISNATRLNVVDVTIAERIDNPTVPADWYVVEQTNVDCIVVWQSSSGGIWETAPGAISRKLYESLCEYLEL